MARLDAYDSTAMDDSSSLDWIRKKWSGVLKVLSEGAQERLGATAPPLRLHLAVTGTNTQKTAEGCCIFALSAAKKMISEPRIEALHQSVLNNLAEGRLEPRIVALDAARTLPPAFFKHSTARGTVDEYLRSRRAQHEAALQRASAPVPLAIQAAWDRPVNKQNQTLLQRFESRLVNRFDAVAPTAQLVRTLSTE